MTRNRYTLIAMTTALASATGLAIATGMDSDSNNKTKSLEGRLILPA